MRIFRSKPTTQQRELAMQKMPLTAHSLNLFNQQQQAFPQLGQTGLLSQFTAIPPYKEGVSYTKRVPNCQKCGQHGRKSRLKGHKRVCPFKDCTCAKCQVVTERQKLMADQIKIRRRQRKDNIMNLKALNAAAAVAAATDSLPYINNLNMLCKQMTQTQPAAAENSSAENAAVSSSATTIPQVSFSSGALLSSHPSMHASSTTVVTTTATGGAFSPAHTSHGDASSPATVNSPMSMVGGSSADVGSLSPHINPRAYTFDLGFLNASTAAGLPAVSSAASNAQLLSAVLSSTAAAAAAEPKSDTSVNPVVCSAAAAARFDLTPPNSAGLTASGLAAPIPVNPLSQQQPIVTSAASAAQPVNYEQLLALAQLLSLNQPVVSAPVVSMSQQPSSMQQPSAFQFAQPTVTTPQVNVQDVLSIASLLLQVQQQQQQQQQQNLQPHLSPQPEGEKAHEPSPSSTAAANNNFIDVLSV